MLQNEVYPSYKCPLRMTSFQFLHSGILKSSRVRLPFSICASASFSVFSARSSIASLPSLAIADEPQIRFIFGMASRMRLSTASVSRRGVPQPKRLCTPQLRKSGNIIYVTNFKERGGEGVDLQACFSSSSGYMLAASI